MANDLNESLELEPQVDVVEPDSETWDWVLAAGVSREDLLRTLELQPR